MYFYASHLDPALKTMAEKALVLLETYNYSMLQYEITLIDSLN